MRAHQWVNQHSPSCCCLWPINSVTPLLRRLCLPAVDRSAQLAFTLAPRVFVTTAAVLGPALSAESAEAFLPTGLQRLAISFCDTASEGASPARPPAGPVFPAAAATCESSLARLARLSPGLARLAVQDCGLQAQQALCSVLRSVLSGPTRGSLRELEIARCVLSLEVAAEIASALSAAEARSGAGTAVAAAASAGAVDSRPAPPQLPPLVIRLSRVRTSPDALAALAGTRAHALDLVDVAFVADDSPRAPTPPPPPHPPTPAAADQQLALSPPPPDGDQHGHDHAAAPGPQAREVCPLCGTEQDPSPAGAVAEACPMCGWERDRRPAAGAADREACDLCGLQLGPRPAAGAAGAGVTARVLPLNDARVDAAVAAVVAASPQLRKLTCLVRYGPREAAAGEAGRGLLGEVGVAAGRGGELRGRRHACPTSQDDWEVWGGTRGIAEAEMPLTRAVWCGGAARLAATTDTTTGGAAAVDDAAGPVFSRAPGALRLRVAPLMP